MQKRTFGRTGLQVTPLGFGAAPAGFLNMPHAEAAALFNGVLDAGVNVIDTACCYPGSEEAIGKAVAHRRREYVLISKCGHRSGDLSGEEFSGPLVTASVEQSLRRLRTDVIDVMFIHSCKLDKLRQGGSIEALIKAKAAGKVRFIGYSGDNEAAAWAAAQSELDAVETSVNLADQVNVDQVLPICVAQHKGVVAKRPIANACWKPLNQQPGMYQNYASEYTRRFQAMGLRAADLGLAEADWPSIALRFTLAQPGVHTAIVGTTSLSNTRANIAAAAQGPLEASLVQRIRQAFAAAQKAAGKPWPGLT